MKCESNGYTLRMLIGENTVLSLTFPHCRRHHSQLSLFPLTYTKLCCSLQNGSSNGELLIKNAQLKLAGRYTCTAQTPVDNVTASAHLVVRGES